MTEKNWTPLEHAIYRDLKDISLQGKKCLLMVSGGADSVALLSVFQNLHSALGCQMEILYCHHGPAEPQQEKYRDQAQQFVSDLAQKFQIPFHVFRSQHSLSSEEALRDFRKSMARTLRDQLHFDWVVWGHHQDDVLETQILRLIRGAGPQAVMEPMKLVRNFDLRPLLQTSRADILSYLHNQKLEWLEDPSNEDESYLRNWLRKTWLPLLEIKCPGALKSFSRSLGLIQESFIETLPDEIWVGDSISRPLFLTLSEAQKKQILALYLQKLGQKEFTHNQIKEVLKHLDISQTNHTFKAAHLIWSLSKDLISAKSPFVVNAF